MVVLGLNTADDRAIAEKFLDENGVTYQNILDTTPAAWEITQKFETLGGMSAVPFTYVIDPEGKVVDAWYGFEKGRMEKLLEKLDL